jgi:hypothetical protein
VLLSATEGIGAVHARVAALAEGTVAAGSSALIFLTDVDRHAGEVVEVEALELVVAEDNESIRLDLGQLRLQCPEGVANALCFALILFEVIHRDILAQGTVRAYLVPALRRHVAERAVRGVEYTNYLCHLISS